MNDFIFYAMTAASILAVGTLQVYILNTVGAPVVHQKVDNEETVSPSQWIPENDFLRSALETLIGEAEKRQEQYADLVPPAPQVPRLIEDYNGEMGAPDANTSSYELVFCMTTSPRFNTRKQQIDGYLSSTLELYKLNFEADPLLKARSLVVIMNTAAPGANKAFTKAQSQHRDPSFVFIEHIDLDWKDPYGKTDPRSGRPGIQARKQTHDIMSLLSICRPSHIRNGMVSRTPIYPLGATLTPAFITLVEDDFFPCPFGLSTMLSVLKDMPACRPRHDWALATFAEGMNGIVLHESKVDAYITYMGSQQDKHPCDLMIRQPWFKDPVTHEPHKWMEFKYALFQHMGRASSFHFRMERSYIKKYGYRKGRQCYHVRESYTYNRKKKNTARNTSEDGYIEILQVLESTTGQRIEISAVTIVTLSVTRKSLAVQRPPRRGYVGTIQEPGVKSS